MSYKPLKSFKTKEEKAKYVHNTLLEEGYKPLEEYTRNSVPIKVLIKKGQYKGYEGAVIWNNFIQGKRIDFRGLLDKSKFLKDKIESEGYRIIHIPDNVRVTDKLDLISPEGNEWSVAYDTFRTGVRCPLDSDRSWGERCVSTVLKENNISFKPQYAIRHPDNTKQFLDFYVEGDIAIEYHGRQHYEQDPKNRLFSKLSEQQEADRKKIQYCKNNGLTYIEIPYTVNEVNAIAKLLSGYLPIDVTKQYKVESYRYDEQAVVDYYRTHTEVQTAEKFNISGSTVKNIARRNNFYKNRAKNGGSFA